MSKENVRTTVVLPGETAEKLRKFVPARKRSKFVAEAIEQYLMQAIYQQGRELSFGAWKDDDYPHLSTHDDVRRYIAELRDRDHWRRPAGKES